MKTLVSNPRLIGNALRLCWLGAFIGFAAWTPAAHVLFVVADPQGTTGGDGAVVQRLQTLGHAVTRVGDADVNPDDAIGKDLILISASVNAALVGQTFRESTLPVVLWEPALFHDMGMTGPTETTDWGQIAAQSHVRIADETHPLAAGLAHGAHEVLLFPQTFSWGQPNTNAQVVATLEGDGSRAVVFVYPTAAAMPGLEAPGYRIGYYLHAETAGYWNPVGWELFAAMIDWILDITAPEPGPPPPRPPAVHRLLPAVESPGPSSRRTDLVFSEIMYHPRDRADGKDLEFIEITNTSPFTQDLGGYRIEGEITYTFPASTTLAPHARLVVARLPADLASETGLDGILGPWSGRLGNGGGDLILRNAPGHILLELTYSDLPPWPAAADGGGSSLELLRPSYGEASPLAWGASRHVGGTPGLPPDTEWDEFDFLRINEVLVHTDLPAEDQVEIINLNTQAVDLAGLVLTDHADQNLYVFPADTVLAGGDFLVLSASQFGFGLSAAGEKVFLLHTGTPARVLDAMAWPAQANGRAYGRFPDGADRIAELTHFTPGQANAGPAVGEVVISEIMYAPPDLDRDGQYVELFNPTGNPVDLSHWRFTDGISFVFPAGTVIPAQGHLVVARNRDRLIAQYPQLHAGNTVGNFGGSLSRSGERLLLAKPDNPNLPNQDFVTVDEVTYVDGGRWSAWADKGGSSLELIDPYADNDHPSAWAASDESAKSAWVTFTTNGILDNLEAWDVTPDQIQLFLLDEGECLVDGIEVLDAHGQPVLANGDFEAGIDGWVIQGNHIGSRWEPGEGEGGSSASFRLVASGGGDNSVNRVESYLTTPLAKGDAVTLRLRARWLRGMPRLLLRLQGNHFELSAGLAVPETPGSPGLPNSVAAANTGPTLGGLRHFPLLPVAGEEVTVEVVAYDPDGIGGVTLFHRQEGQSYVQTAMRDDGIYPDLHAGDSRYTALLPGLGSGKIAEFYVRAEDAAFAPLASRIPAETPALVRFGQSVPDADDFHGLTLWMTQSNLTEWASRQSFSNHLLPASLVLGEDRVIHGAGVRYRGSPFIRPNFNGPLGTAISSYVVRVPKDDPVLGIATLNLDSLEQPDRDDTLQRERMSFWMARKLGLPSVHQRYVRMAINGVPRGQVYADTQQPNRDYLKSVFPDAQDGAFYEIDDWFEFNDVVQRIGNRSARLEPYRDGDGRLAKRRYRWSWQRKDHPGILQDDAVGLFDLVEAFEAGDPAALLSRLDPEGWIGTLALRRAVADWDGYGFHRGKNTHMYRPPGGKWTLLPWDLDFSLGGGSRDPTHGLFEEIEDPVMAGFLSTPVFERIYWRQLIAFAEGPMAAAAFEPASLEIHHALANKNVSVVPPSTALWDWVAARRAFILSEAAAIDQPLAILTQGGNDFSTAENPVTLTGTAPLRAKTLRIHGVDLPLTWSDPHTWTASVFLNPGANPLVLTAIGQDGLALAGIEATIGITYTGEGQNLAADFKLTEIMYHAPEGPGWDFLEFKNIGASTLVLDGVRVADNSGTFVFPIGSTLAPGAHLILSPNPANFAAKYPGIPVFGQIPFHLSNGGETIWIHDATGQLLLEVAYDDVPPWPIEADGDGYSLVPISPNPTQDLSLASSWQPSCSIGGSPGEDDPGFQDLPPFWSAEPQDQVVSQGGGASFLAAAMSCPPPAYQWFVDGEALPGETGKSLVLANLGALDHGAQIVCVASNTHGIATSRVATLYVDPGLPARVTENLVVYYLFLEGQGTRVADLSGLAPALDLDFTGGGITWLPGGQGVDIAGNSSLVPAISAGKIQHALAAANAFTLETWAKPAHIPENGASLVSYSLGTSTRNLTLGQDGADLEIFLRTHDAATSDNGTPSTLVADAVDSDLRHWVVIRADSSLTVWRDGVALATNSIPGDLSNWSATYEFLLANDSSGDRPWLGELWLVALYDRALTPAEIEGHFALGPDAGAFLVEPPDLPLPLVELSPVEAPQGQVRIEWDTFTNAVYRLQWTPGLIPADWQNIGPAFWGDGARGGITVHGPDTGCGFFRALQFPQAAP